MSLVKKTIHGGLIVLGDAVVEALSATTGIFSSTLDVTGKITGSNALEIATTGWIKGNTTIGEPTDNLKTLTVYGNISIPAGGYTTGLIIEKAIDLNIGASTAFDVSDGYFRFSDGTNLFKVDSNGIQIDATTVGIGNASVAGTQLYVYDKGVTGNIAEFNSVYIGASNVKIASRTNYDAQLHFYQGSTFEYMAGIDGTGNAFCVSGVTGDFSSATDILRLSTSSSQYLQSSTSVLLYLKGLNGQSTLVVNSSTGNDAQVYFRENVTTKAAVGWDAGDDALKLRYGTSISGTAAISIGSTNAVTIPDLSGTGARAVYASATGLLETVTAPQREMKVKGYKITHTTQPSTLHDLFTLGIGGVIHNIEVWGQVGFNDAAVAKIHIGYNADSDEWGNFDVRNTTGVIPNTVSSIAQRLSVERTITAFVEETSGSSAGEAYVYIWYTEPSSEEEV